MSAAEADVGLGGLLRHWRRVRGRSQLDLASDARTTARYVSFVETGRAQPSRQMVVRLARALDVPLRERNALLLAAGYAPLYAAAPLDSPELRRVDAALRAMLAQHEPFPAVVMDRGWDILRANDGAGRLFGGLCAPDAVPEPANVLALMVEPGPVRDAVRNWETVVVALFERTRREALGGVLEPDTAARVGALRARPDVAAVLGAAEPAPPGAPVLDVWFAFAEADLRFFSVVSTIGTPADVTAQEVRVEAVVPSEDATRAAWNALSA